METRFSRDNLDLMKAVNCLLPQSPSFLDVALLRPLQKLAGTACSDSLSNEICVPKVMLEKKFTSAVADLSTICKHPLWAHNVTLKKEKLGDSHS